MASNRKRKARGDHLLGDRRCVHCRPDPIEEIKSEFARAFDRIKTGDKPREVQIAELTLSRRARTDVEYTIIAGHIRARMEPPTDEKLDDAIYHACRELKISERTARSAWSWAHLNKR